MDLTNPTKIYSRIHLIDMAGNDSCGRPKFFKNCKQIGQANVTKSQLELFFLCLSKNIPMHTKAKERMNALLYYLDGDFSPESVLRFIGHIKLRNEDLVTTLSMLRFGNIAQGLKMKTRFPMININEEVELEYLKKKLCEFENEVHLNSVLMNQNLVAGMNQARAEHLNVLVQEYLSDKVQDVTVMNVAETKLVLKHVKQIYVETQNNYKKIQAENEMLQASQKSDTNLKLKASRTSSQMSGKISRKSSSKIRSKDSITRESITKEPSGSALFEKRIKQSLSDDNLGSETAYVAPKRKKSIKSNSGFPKQTAQSKRKSSNSSIEKHNSKTSVSGFDILMPTLDLVPEKQETWKSFASSSNAYKDLVEEYRQNEKEVKINFINYVTETKKLQQCRENLDKCKNDLILAQTVRKFHSPDRYDDRGQLVLSDAERGCNENIEEAEEQLLKQQEKVLVAQEMLKVHLDQRRKHVKAAEDQFEQYCQENFHLPSGDVESLRANLYPHTFEFHLDRPDSAIGLEERIYYIPEVSDKAQAIRNLQKLMFRERNRKKQRENKIKHQWKNF